MVGIQIWILVLMHQLLRQMMEEVVNASSSNEDILVEAEIYNSSGNDEVVATAEIITKN